MKVAICGCVHGSIDKVYETIQYCETQENISIDLLLCCGDFQAIRNEEDMNTLACPPHHRKFGSFHRFYDGSARAPFLTLVVGGNHEASNFLAQNFFGGFLAPNIYYLGNSGVVTFGGLRIAGISGIFKHYDFQRGYFEQLPLNNDTKRSIYHIRDFDLFKLENLTPGIDIILSHDWPQGILNFGNVRQLRKRFNDNPGCPAFMPLLHKLRPNYWFAAHHHVKFPALVPLQNDNENESYHQMTHFLALGKAGLNQDFLQILDIEPKSNEIVTPQLCYDPEWLAITYLTLPLFEKHNNKLPFTSYTQIFHLVCDHLKKIKHILTANIIENLKSQLCIEDLHPFKKSWTLEGNREEFFNLLRSLCSKKFSEEIEKEQTIETIEKNKEEIDLGSDDESDII